jgi:alpha-tubulin suppressor-like RCC1 family protein
VTLVEDLSGFVDLHKDKPLNISHISCGRKHCIAAFDYGAFFIWGDNENG